MKYICFNEGNMVYFCQFPLERFGVFFNHDLLCIDGREAVKTGVIVSFYSIPYLDNTSELLKKEIKKELNKAIFNFLNSKEQNCFNLTQEASKICNKLKAEGTSSKMKELEKTHEKLKQLKSEELEKFKELKKSKEKESKQLTVKQLEELIKGSKEKTREESIYGVKKV